MRVKSSIAGITSLAAACAVAAGPAGASDGVIEINQAKAMAGGVTAADAAGFPVSIDASGSYLLTGDLLLADGNTNAIEIGAGATVTLDLNGFAIDGGMPCEAEPCAATGATGSGVVVPAALVPGAVTIVNGTIRRMGSAGVQSFYARLRVERVRVVQNGGVGILAVGPDCHVSENLVGGNGGKGLWVGFGCLVRGNAVSHNGGEGIRADADGALVSGNTVHFNSGDGISSYGVNQVTGNTISSNSGYGLQCASLGGGTGYTGNVIYGGVSGCVEMGTNLCDGDTVCP